MDGTSYYASNQAVPMSRDNPIDLGVYSDTFNIAFGTTNKQIDFFDNPYIEINVYDLDEHWHISKSSTQLRSC